MSKINLKSVNQPLSNKELKDVHGGGWGGTIGGMIGIRGIIGIRGGNSTCSYGCNTQEGCSRADGSVGLCGHKLGENSCRCH